MLSVLKDKNVEKNTNTVFPSSMHGEKFYLLHKDKMTAVATSIIIWKTDPSEI